jgi:hypothetical protein
MSPVVSALVGTVEDICYRGELLSDVLLATELTKAVHCSFDGLKVEHGRLTSCFFLFFPSFCK